MTNGIKYKIKPTYEELENELVEANETINTWRELALQFDRHRMEALWFLKQVVNKCLNMDKVEEFINKPPISGEEILNKLLSVEVTTEQMLKVITEHPGQLFGRIALTYEATSGAKLTDVAKTLLKGINDEIKNIKNNHKQS